MLASSANVSLEFLNFIGLESQAASLSRLWEGV